MASRVNREKSEESQTTTLKPALVLKRQRAKRSCDFCRKRKSKCDADVSTPCTNCLSWGFECQFQSKSKKRGPRSPYVTRLEERCKELEALLSKYTGECSSEMLTHKSDEDFSDDHDGSQDEQSYNDPIAIDDPRLDDGHDTPIEEQLANISLDNYDSLKYTGASAGLRIIDKSIFEDGYVVWPGRQNVILKMLPQDELVVVKTNVSRSGSPDIKMNIGIGMQMGIFESSADNIWNANTACNSKLSNSTLNKHVTSEQQNQLIDAYFQDVHATFPVLNKQRFLQQYESGSVPSVLLFSVLCTAYRYVKPENMQLTIEKDDLDVYLRKRIMTYLRCHASRSVIHIVQANLLMALYLDLDNHDTDSSQWYALGNAIRMAQELGMHRSSASWKIPASEIETRHRIYYACYIMDRWIGARFGKPLTILDRDFDTGFPSAYEVSDVAGDIESNHTKDDQEPVYLAFLHLIKLSEILGRVLKALYAPKAKYSNRNAGIDDPTILLVFDRRLAYWKSMLDAGMIPKAKGDPKPDPSDPTTSEARKVPIKPEQRVCSQAATSIINLADQTKLQDFLAASPITSIYSVFQAALISLYNVTQGSATKQATANLRRSMDFLLERKNLTVVSRVIEILKLLTALNGVSDQSILSPSEVEVAPPTPTSNHTKQKRRSRPHIAASPLSNSTRYVEPKIEEMDAEFAKQVFTKSSMPAYAPFTDDPENEMPKAQWIQRIMSTSVVGGISPELQPSMQSVLAPNPDGMMPGPQPGLIDTYSSNMLSNLDTSQNHAPPMAMRSPDQNIRPWNHLQMLPQSYFHYSMDTETFAATEEQSSNSVSNATYQPPFNGIVPSQSAVHSNAKVDNNGANMATTSQQTMFQQDQTPLMLNMVQTQQELQDMRTNMPPSSLNWEDWDSYVNQEISRTQ
ncbi:hypothetical protein INT43_005398 [Umbelopsis isabellina]|uniref:Zn(2)-C6 fungal-type domain-containing protein n=1 Tax=Mortierella isabellina TaxID=91625 RepID=A0A8H7UAX6_MORIS|nr:hypothetical protein INT43_005398 [Umbelopsis isabellina]